jgi:hypothetical protein
MERHGVECYRKEVCKQLAIKKPRGHECRGVSELRDLSKASDWDFLMQLVFEMSVAIITSHGMLTSAVLSMKTGLLRVLISFCFGIV